jgi:flagellar basal-body rod modification protein FlgD
MTIAAAQSSSTASLVASLNGTPSTKSTDATAELSDRFLRLLVTQLQNQDPMNPMENAELTTQLAQMSTVEGINKMNASLSGLVADIKANQVLQGASLIGRQVLAEGEVLNLGSSGAAGAVELGGAADSVKINIFNSKGVLVNSMDLGEQDAGLVRFAWDGANADAVAQPLGSYTFSVVANAGASSVAATQYSLGGVLSVSLNGGDLDVEIDGLGERGLNQIRQIF